MAARSIDGPEPDFLDMADLTRILRLSESTIRRLIRDGLFPEPVEVSRGVRMWLWTDAVYWSLYAQLRSRLTVRNVQGASGGSQEASSEQRDAPED